MFQLPRQYQTGEKFELDWREDRTFPADATHWGRGWLAVMSPNGNFDAELVVTFADDPQLPDSCWRYRKEPDTDVSELGPTQPSELFDFSRSRTVRHSWSRVGTESWLDVGILSV